MALEVNEMREIDDEMLYSPEEVARLLRVAEDTVRSWLRKCTLRGIKVGKLWRIRGSEVRRFLDAPYEK